MTAHTTLTFTRWVCDRYGHETWAKSTLTQCPHIRAGKACPGLPVLTPERPARATPTKGPA